MKMEKGNYVSMFEDLFPLCPLSLLCLTHSELRKVVTKWELCPKGGDLPILMPPIASTDDQGLREVSFQLPLDLRLSVSKN